MKKGFINAAAILALIWVAVSIAGYFAGKFRTSFYSFEFAVGAFLLLFLLSLLDYFIQSNKTFLALSILLFLSIGSLFGFNFIEDLKKTDVKNYQEWVLHAKQKGLVLELPFTKKHKRPNKEYQKLLIENHLNEMIQGYSRQDIFPRFNTLTGAYFAQLDFLGVRYVVFHTRKGDEKTELNVINLPIAASFNKELVFKVPKRKPKVAVIYDSHFKEMPGSTGNDVKWVEGSQGSIYLHNNEYAIWGVSLQLELIAKSRVKASVRFVNQNKQFWSGWVDKEGVRIEIPSLKLLSGQNRILIQKEEIPDQQENTVLKSINHNLIGVRNIDIEHLGINPEKVAEAIDKEWIENAELNKWIAGLPDSSSYLEYPLAYNDWSTPIEYGRDSKLKNFYFDHWEPKFAAKYLGNKPTPALALWMKSLGIDYLILHQALYVWPPIINEGCGFKGVKKFGDTLVLKTDLNKIDFESELALRQTGKDVVDAQAQNRMARKVEAKPNEKREQYMVFGPHAPLIPGRYRASFQVKVDQLMNRPFATLDVACRQGEQILKDKKLSGKDFKEPNQYETFSLDFELKQTEKIEFRILINDRSLNIWSDKVVLEKLS